MSDTLIARLDAAIHAHNDGLPVETVSKLLLREARAALVAQQAETHVRKCLSRRVVTDHHDLGRYLGDLARAMLDALCGGPRGPRPQCGLVLTLRTDGLRAGPRHEGAAGSGSRADTRGVARCEASACLAEGNRGCGMADDRAMIARLDELLHWMASPASMVCVDYQAAVREARAALVAQQVQIDRQAEIIRALSDTAAAQLREAEARVLE